MPITIRRQAAVWLALSLGTFACKGDKTQDTAASCDLPQAAAGADQSVTLGATVSLDGSGSSWCEQHADQIKFNWSIQAPAGSAVDETALSDNKAASATAPTFKPDEVGDYVIALVVSDPGGDSAPDYLVVHVTSADSAPVADCGGPYSGNVEDVIQLDGSASFDPENAEMAYYWTLTDTPTCSGLSSSQIYNSGGPTPTVVPDCDGIFTVSLVVSDGIQYSDVATCYVDVASENRAPVADAGDTAALGACADNPIQLDGYGSYDLDGDELTYQWSLVSAPSGSATTDDSFDDTTLPNPKFTWDEVGAYLFQLQVYDGTEWSAPDIVTMTIDDSSSNHGPVANAGEDQTMETSADCTSASYVWTCEDCAELSVELDGSSSYDADGDELYFYWSEATEVLKLSNPYGALTDAVVSAQPSEYGVDNTMVLTVNLDVADCEESANDSITVTYTCTGEKP